MANTLVIAPFAASADALPGGTHFVTDHVKLEPLPDGLKMCLTDYLDGIDEAELGKLVRQRPAFTIPVNDVSVIRSLASVTERCNLGLQIHRFCLEYFAGAPIPMIAFMHDGTKVVHHEIDRDGLLLRSADGVTFSKEAWEKQLAYARFVYGAAARAPAFEPVVTRLCRAFREGSSPDGIIDLAIAMESLVQTKLEVKFQFSLFNSLMSSDDLAVRTERIELLKNLYDARSITVHGGKPGRKDKPKVQKVIDNWDALIQLARGNLTYYLNFCRHHEHEAWTDHLWSLSLGSARFAPEEGAT